MVEGLNDADLPEKAAKLARFLDRCRLCPRKCGVNRNKGERGFCRSGPEACVSSWNLHFGEEPPISGNKGSGTIFFTNCNLGCVFCQNYPISHLGHGNNVSSGELAGIMIDLEKRGAHNINLVTPTHIIPAIVAALVLAGKRGLSAPIVYNSGGYESLEVIKLLEGIINVYMPDAKYYSRETAGRYSNAPDYSRINIKALKEMYRQTGELKVDSSGAAVRGMIIRHLVLPGQKEDSIRVLREIAENISNRVYLSIMAQYHPAYKAVDDKDLSRTVKRSEYEAVLEEADRLGFENGYRQEI